jgi:hypothetical protein
MEKSAKRSGKRAAARRRAIRRRAAAWKRRARRALAMMLIAASIGESPARLANAQVGQLSQGGVVQGTALAGGFGGGGVGQSAMAPASGIVGGAVGRLASLEEYGPGWLYYGINAADRGLGYRGSYYTIGGFIPYGEDDLGGIWSADLRTHLSNYGGFFSNVGTVRKQFFGGTLFGVGVYWDYDGDQSQYANTTIKDDSGSYVFAGGQTYNQVGVSAEWLTDYGNIRSNGYIPVGNTAQIMGPFVGNSLLCTNGINAALAGTDLEIGAYIPGLADWAGMVSVGGYAYGNSRYNFVNGQDVVPWFGGVYTRLDMTLIKNWDFSLQANNDSYFDWTGFARLTYRMGGSRRRNVPEQMEQPMFRNEHVVRAHTAPEQALIPNTPAAQAAGVAGTPYKVIHVDSSLNVAAGGTGTWERPVKTLQDAQAIANQAYDIVFVRVGDSLNCPYDTGPDGYQFQADNQYLVGEGTSLMLCTANCGNIPLWSTTGSSTYPVITNPTGPAIVVDRDGSNVDHLAIVGAKIGITDGTVGMTAPNSQAYINDVRITGNGPSQTGVLIRDLSGNGGTFNFTNMTLESLTADGFVVDGQGNGNPFVNISDSKITDTSGSGIVVNGIARDGRARIYTTTIANSTGPAIVVSGANAIVEKSTILNLNNYGISVSGSPVIGGVVAASGTSTVQVTDSIIQANIGIQGSAPNDNDLIDITISNNLLTAPAGGNGINLAVNGSGTAAGGPSGAINANIIGNRITGLATTAYYTGTAGGITRSIQLASDIYLTTSNTAAGLTSLSVKAVGPDNLAALNNDAVISTMPKPNPATTGTSATFPPPPPPNYDPALIVPLPRP